MSVDDWIHLAFLGTNVVIGAVLYMAKLQMKVMMQDQDKACSLALEQHNEDGQAHSNHAHTVALEEKFVTIISELSSLSTRLAVLTERLDARIDRKANRRLV